MGDADVLLLPIALIRLLGYLIHWKEGIIETAFQINYLPRLHWNRFFAIQKMPISIYDPEKHIACQLRISLSRNSFDFRTASLLQCFFFFSLSTHRRSVS